MTSTEYTGHGYAFPLPDADIRQIPTPEHFDFGEPNTTSALMNADSSEKCPGHCAAPRRYTMLLLFIVSFLIKSTWEVHTGKMSNCTVQVHYCVVVLSSFKFPLQDKTGAQTLIALRPCYTLSVRTTIQVVLFDT